MNVNSNTTVHGAPLQPTCMMKPNQLNLSSSITLLPVTSIPSTLSSNPAHTHTIEDLLSRDMMRNKAYGELWSKYTEVVLQFSAVAMQRSQDTERFKDTERFIEPSEERYKLRREHQELKTEYRELKTGYQQLNTEYQELKIKYLELLRDKEAWLEREKSTSDTDSFVSLSPSDSASHRAGTASATPILVDQPVDRPEEYPKDVLWNFEDIRSCSQIKLKKHNESRPPIRPCLRTTTGSIIQKNHWNEIRRYATVIVRETLLPLVKNTSDLFTFRKKYFNDNWPKKWDEAMARLETRDSILKLCFGHWKADLVIQNALDAAIAKIIKNTTLSLPPSAAPPPAQENNVSLSSPQTTLQSPAETAPSPPSSSSSEHSGPKPVVPKHKIQPESPARGNKRRCTNHSGPSIPNNDVPSVMNVDAEASKIDITGTAVTASYAAMKDIVTKDPSFQYIPHILDLLEVLHRIPETAAASSSPSPAVEEFVIKIERADPNSPDVNQEYIDKYWGYQHFCSGSIRYHHLTWELVANKQVAYRILAATIRTCLVSRLLCSKRNIPPYGIVADSYLEIIVGNLLDHLRTVVEPYSAKSKENYSPNLSRFGVFELRDSSYFEIFRIPQLKVLTARLNVKVPRKKGKHIVKKDYLTALASVPLADINKHWVEMQLLDLKLR